MKSLLFLSLSSAHQNEIEILDIKRKRVLKFSPLFYLKIPSRFYHSSSGPPPQNSFFLLILSKAINKLILPLIRRSNLFFNGRCASKLDRKTQNNLVLKFISSKIHFVVLYIKVNP